MIIRAPSRVLMGAVEIDFVSPERVEAKGRIKVVAAEAANKVNRVEEGLIVEMSGRGGLRMKIEMNSDVISQRSRNLKSRSVANHIRQMPGQIRTKTVGSAIRNKIVATHIRGKKAKGTVGRSKVDRI